MVSKAMAEQNIVRTIMSWNTEYSADSVEWCPVESWFNFFVCGTYQIQKEKEEENEEDAAEKSSASQIKIGRICLFYVDRNVHSLNPLQTIETAAVLDQKWCQHLISGKPYLGVVNAGGFLQIYKLSSDDDNHKLELVTEFQISQESKVLALSLDWSTAKNKSEQPQIVVSDSCGNITVCILRNGLAVEKLSSWNAHNFEAWICAFDYWDTSVIYTGGDDSCLRVYDQRSVENAKLVNRSHQAGVTSLHSNCSQEYILASGSYDESIRLWDTRRFKRPLAEQALGGGVWRVKWDPVQHEVLLAACMYGGFRVVDTQHFSAAAVVAEYNEHTSIAYGADWCQDMSWFHEEPESTFRRTIATCSFYDCKLNIAQIKY